MTPYAEAIVGNIRAERARLRMSQASVTEGMRAHGFTNWHRQTMSKLEAGERNVLAEEVLVLAELFGVPVMTLLSLPG